MGEVSSQIYSPLVLTLLPLCSCTHEGYSLYQPTVRGANKPHAHPLTGTCTHTHLIVTRPWESSMRCMVECHFPTVWQLFCSVCCGPTRPGYIIINKEMWVFEIGVAKQQTTNTCMHTHTYVYCTLYTHTHTHTHAHGYMHIARTHTAHVRMHTHTRTHTKISN